MGNIISQNNSVIWLQEQNHDTRFTSSCCICYWRKKKTPQFEWKCLLWGFSGLKRSLTERLPEREAELNYFTSMRPGCKETFRIASSVVQFFCTCAENSNKLVYLPISVIANTNFNPSIEPIYWEVPMQVKKQKFRRRLHGRNTLDIIYLQGNQHWGESQKTSFWTDLVSSKIFYLFISFHLD